MCQPTIWLETPERYVVVNLQQMSTIVQQFSITFLNSACDINDYQTCLVCDWSIRDRPFLTQPVLWFVCYLSLVMFIYR